MNNNNNNMGYKQTRRTLFNLYVVYTHTWKDEGNPGNAPTIFYCVWIGHQLIIIKIVMFLSIAYAYYSTDCI